MISTPPLAAASWSGSAAAGAEDIVVCAAFEQGTRNGGVVFCGGVMERGPTDAVAAGRVGFAGQEKADNLWIAAFHSKMERGSSRGIGSVHSRPRLDEDGRDFRTVAEDGLLQRRHARIGSGLGESGVGGEKALGSLHVSTCDGFVD